MTRRSRAACLTLALLLAGCGSGTIGAHGGDGAAGADAADAGAPDGANDDAGDAATGDAGGDDASADGGPQPLGFPRLGGMLIGNPKNYDEAAYQAQVARLDVAVLGMYSGWHRNGTTPAQAVAAIRALNPAIRLANYTIMTEVTSDTSDTSSQYLRDKLGAEAGPGGVGDWWAYDAAGQHTDWSGGSYGSWDTNLTLLTTADANGDRWPQWSAKAHYDHLLAGAGFDTWYCDNNFWRPRSTADWNRDGTNDSRDDVTVRGWWRDGQRAYYDTAKVTAPDLLVMVNADSDLDGTVYPAGADHFAQYAGVVNAAFIEHGFGASWSVETWGSWAQLMAWYRHLFDNLLAPKIVVLDAGFTDTTDYQYLRYALASALLEDGYFSASTDYNEIPWFDEFDLAGTASTKWLGQPVDPPPTAPWLQGVYRRRFDGGVALVNPKGNGAQTVTLEAGYRRFLGTQAPAVNDGQPVTSLTLADRDGILLVRE
jgi:hypothetical protein